MNEYNVIEEQIMPENPKVLDDEYFEVYLPIANYSVPGIAFFDPKHFFITKEGKVSIQDYAIDSMNAAIKACEAAAARAESNASLAHNRLVAATEASQQAKKAAEEAQKSIRFRYTISVSKNVIILTGSDGSTSQASFPTAEGIGV